MIRRLIPLSVAIVALAAGVAAATTQLPAGVVTLVPNVAGKPTTVKVDANPQAIGMPTSVPSKVVIGVQRGFKLDPRAAPGRCSDQQASQNSCPNRSRVASGSASGTYSLSGVSGTFNASLGVFATGPAKKGKLPRLVVVFHEPSLGATLTAHGRVSKLSAGPFGYRVKFSFPQLPSYPGLTVTVDHVTLNAGAKHKSRHLLTNPRTCSGSYLLRLSATYPNAPAFVGDAHPACTG